MVDLNKHFCVQSFLDLRSVARNCSLPYAQRNVVVEDLRWIIEAQRSKHNKSVRSDRQRLRRQGRIIVTRNFSPESTRSHSTGTRSPRMVKPLLRSPSRRWEKDTDVCVVVDTVATCNALLGRDWIHSSWCVPSTLHQELIFWNGGKAEVVSVDDKPFLANTHLVEARYYEKDIGTVRCFGMDRHGKLIGITTCNRPSISKCVIEEVCDELLQPTAIIPYRPKGKLKIEEI
ncbi:hypothetical protein SLEP1_g31349 [Rubroshorea leprosula]|uniref:Uncharacterized protein n=1 Tax=Rubroshorea leprosula TaxID=152421 RepID=A0AAV5KAD7_9ROSI|nr:hypothetical protein SLEP1_g31349 [Rubroshorea leprosula]